MRYSLLDLLASPDTHAPFVLVGAVETPNPYVGPYGTLASRVSHANSAVGPAPEGESGAFYVEHLASHVTAAADPERDKHVIVTEGLLVATDTGMWYPIVDTIPEILPASLRDWRSHRDFLDQIIAPRLPPDLVAALRRSIESVETDAKPGDRYKTSEISLIDKVDNKAEFLGPGLQSPFNPYVYNHPADLIRGFSNSLPFLQIKHGSRILDSGSGYSWTTEWLMKLGMDAVGIDISRIYQDVGRRRMGPNNQPHLVVGDSENLPFGDGVFDAVLCFDAFHHIPNRPIAMRQYARTLNANGRVVLVEPGDQHETAEMSVNVMNTYGIMEVGMELADIQSYIEGVETFSPARQIFLNPYFSDDTRANVPAAELRNRNYIGWGMFVVDKTGASVSNRLADGGNFSAAPTGRSRFINRVLGRTK